MKQKKGFVLREVCGDKVIAGEGLNAIDFGKLVKMNATAVWLWEKTAELDDFTIEQLADELCNQYSVDQERALSDVSTLINQWKELGLVE